MPRGALLAVALLVLTAGCSGFGVDRPADRDPYTVDDPVPLEDPELLPGLTTEGVENASALVDAHRRFLRNESYNASMRQSTALASNGTRVLTRVTYAVVDPTTRRRHYVYEYDRRGSGALRYWYDEQWQNESIGVVRQVRPNESVEYDAAPRYGAQSYSGLEPHFYHQLQRFENSAPKNVTVQQYSVGNETYYVIAQTAPGAWGLLADEPFTVRVVVSEEGLIRSYTVEGTVENDGERIEVVEHAQVTDVGDATVGKPAWVDDALEVHDGTTVVDEETAD